MFFPEISRVSVHFFTNTSYKGCSLWWRRIRLLSFGTASGHIMSSGNDPPAYAGKKSDQRVTDFMGIFFARKYLGVKVNFNRNKISTGTVIVRCFCFFVLTSNETLTSSLFTITYYFQKIRI